MPARECQGLTQGQQPCRQAPLREGAFCFWHDPAHSAEATEARRLGGLRRRRESTLAGAYDFDGLGSTQELRRLLEVAAYDTLGLENSVARARVLTSIVQVGARLLETGELEARVAAIEAALGDGR